MNLRTPFVRDQRTDFASAEGDALLRSQIEMILATDVGELPWRTAFGSRLGRLRQRPNDEVLREVARAEVEGALRKWLPGARVVGFRIAASSSELAMEVEVQGRRITVRRELAP